MRDKQFYLLALIMVATLALAAGPANAQTTAAGPYYSTPSWDQKLQCDTQATCPRFIVLSNWNGEAVLDRETGLVWERSPDANTRNWDFALGHCNARTVGNRMGWRLPTFQELASLLDPSLFGIVAPALPAGHPFTNLQLSERYWSATTLTLPAVSGFVLELAWSADLGVVQRGFGEAPKTTELFAWCVRGGQGMDRHGN